MSLLATVIQGQIRCKAHFIRPTWKVWTMHHRLQRTVAVFEYERNPMMGLRQKSCNLCHETAIYSPKEPANSYFFSYMTFWVWVSHPSCLRALILCAWMCNAFQVHGIDIDGQDVNSKENMMQPNDKAVIDGQEEPSEMKGNHLAAERARIGVGCRSNSLAKVSVRCCWRWEGEIELFSMWYWRNSMQY